MVMNTDFGGPELLPFDLRMKRVIKYHISEKTRDRATERKKLSSILEQGLRAIFVDLEGQITKLDPDPLKVAFQKVKATMPDLISEMREDLSREGNEFIREFFLASRRWVMNTDLCFIYYFEDHRSLQGKIQVMENYGFVIDVTVTNAKKYRMTEEFVEMLLTTGEKE
jgi:hypothetical protein